MGQPYELKKKAEDTGKTVDALIDQAIAKHNGNVRRASIELDVSTEAIYRILRQRAGRGELTTAK